MVNPVPEFYKPCTDTLKINEYFINAFIYSANNIIE